MTVTLDRTDDLEPANRQERRHGPASVETAAELATRLRVARSTIYQLMAEGLPSIKLGGARRYLSADVDAWLEARAHAA